MPEHIFRIPTGGLVRYVIKFVIAGVVSTAVDAMIYWLCVYILHVYPVFAKCISVVGGISTAFVQNLFWVFRKEAILYFENKLWKFKIIAGLYLKFVSTYAISMGVNVGIFTLIRHLTDSDIAAFIVSTGVSATLNFLVIRGTLFNRGLEL